MKRIALILIAFLFLLNAQAQHHSVKIQPPRPKVGVVLSGGGAKGAAHIGVLQYIEELGIPVDYVAGTSMGSIIGGLYAMGYSPEELAQFIAEMDWSQYVGNKIDRSALSQDVRERRSTCIINVPFSLRAFLSKSSTNTPVSYMPSAYVNNMSLINLFNDLCVGYQKEMDFNDLPIPFACVATDIKTGEEFDIRHGSVPTAMRASMAIPGVFAPVVIDGHLLVDGGLVNNFPADVLQEMGADIIIGVDVSQRDTIQNEAVSVLDVLNRLVDNAISTKKDENRERCNIFISPDISGFGTLSFNHDAIDTLVNRGYREAMKYHAPLMEIKHHLEQANGGPLTKQLRATKARNLADAPVFISSVSFNHTDPKKSAWLLKKGNLKVGQFMTEKDITRAIDLYRGTGAFNEITYNLVENGTEVINGEECETYVMNIDFKPTQPHVFGLGARYDTEEGASMLLDLGINGKRLSGWQLGIKGRLSYNPRFNITTSLSHIALARFNLSYEFRSQSFKALNTSTNKYSNLRYQQHRFDAYFSQFQILNFNTAIGGSYQITSFDQVGLYDHNNDTLNQNVLLSDYFTANRLFIPYFTFSYDNLDDSYFARRGINANMTGHFYFDASGASKAVADLSLSFQSYISPGQGRFTIIPQVYSRIVFGDPQYANLWNIVGGEIAGRNSDQQMPFIGLSHVSQAPDMTAITRCDLRYNFIGKHYLTATYNFLIGFNPVQNSRTDFQEMHYSGVGLKYSYNSIMGPISLTGQWSTITKRFGVYFSIGYTF